MKYRIEESRYCRKRSAWMDVDDVRGRGYDNEGGMIK